MQHIQGSSSNGLRELVYDFTNLLSSEPELRRSLTRRFKDYHGFQKVRPSKELQLQLCKRRKLDPRDVQIELVRVNRDLHSEAHLHVDSFAWVLILGEEHNFRNPDSHVSKELYHNIPWGKRLEELSDAELGKLVGGLKRGWKSVGQAQVGYAVPIPPGTIHGFSGKMTFVSVQSPAIDRGEKDDYVNVFEYAQSRGIKM